MANKTDEKEYQDIKVDLIEVGTEQARTSRKYLEQGIDDLAASINRFGLLHPITVYQEEDKYILVAGQRRLLAIKQLGWDETPARVLSVRPDEVEAKAISFSENFIRQDLTNSEKKNACIMFHRRYSSMREASRALGIPYEEVRDFVKYDRLDDQLKKLVDEGTVTADEATRAQDISEKEDGTVDADAAAKAALELKTFDRDQKSHLKEVEKEQPALSVEEKLEEAKKPRKTKRYNIIMALKYVEGLQKAAVDMDKSEEEVAEAFVIEGLAKAGYV